MQRLRFASRYALRHFLISVAVAAISAAFVFGALYPPPFQVMLGVTGIFLLVLAVDVVCGPLLTLLLASPKKSRRERWLDFSLIGLVQIIALAYGLHSLWIARPVLLAFEVDRLLVVTANEVQVEAMDQAPAFLPHLPWWGIERISLRQPEGVQEALESVDLGLAGISPAMQPQWWQPWEKARDAITQRAKPVSELLQHRPQNAETIQTAIKKTRQPASALRYLPLTSTKEKEWVMLLDDRLEFVGYAPVDGF